mmetsp:Transcript_28917/g.69778  ORF Transcript_28917/g.69778 Transcript_28917/m.69778 type:complete len:797 (+) Transcript_28917:293-2683(+)
MRISVASRLLSCLLLFLSTSNYSVNAAKLRRGSVQQNDEIMDDMSSTTADESDGSATRSLNSDSEVFAKRKTPPWTFGNSKCGLLRKQHPGCTRYASPPTPIFSSTTPPPTNKVVSSSPPPTESPTQSPTQLQIPLTMPPVTPPTTAPTGLGDRPLNCVQTVNGSELTIEHSARFYKGDVHCLSSAADGQEEAYFGYTWTNQFGLFVNGQTVWEIPYQQALASVFRWTFQGDGNVVMRSENDKVLWMSGTCCYSGSQLKVSMERVWIESRTGSQLWSEPFFVTPHPTPGPTSPPTRPPTPPPTPSPISYELNCVQTIQGNELTIPPETEFHKGDVHCLSSSGQEAYFGYTWTNQFGLFSNFEDVWTLPSSVTTNFDRWSFQEDGNLVLRDADGRSIWTSESYGNFGSHLRVSFRQVFINRSTGYTLWSQPPYLGPPRPPPNDGYPDPNGTLQYYAYYYPWYLRNNWGRHDYQDEPLLGKYGTNEVAVAEQHIEWALETGITSWVVSYWGPDHLTMKHFKQGMLNAPSIDKIKFCMLYESVILDDRGSWRDGSKEEALYRDLKVIVDEFVDHPSYLKINGRPVIIWYITRSRMPFQEGFDGPSVLANMRRRLGHDIYFIADEPFFNSYNKRPSVNGNAFQGGKQVFDAYTTYNMYLDDRVRDGETATTYQLREGMPIWQEWAEKVPMFPNVMPQYYDFRGNKPLLGNGADFMKQLREVACLPRTNFNGAPHIMFITSFNEWWEGTQIEPEDGSRDNWNNYGFQFMETLAAFKKEVDSRGTHWCPGDSTATTKNGNRN